MHRHTLNSKDFVAVRALPRIPGHGVHRNFMLRPPSRSTNRITVTFMVTFHNVFCRCPWDIRLSRPSTFCLHIADIVHTLAFPAANPKAVARLEGETQHGGMVFQSLRHYTNTGLRLAWSTISTKLQCQHLIPSSICNHLTLH